MNKRYTHHEYKFSLSDGSRVMYNRIQGYSIEDAASMCLHAPTKAQAIEIAQIVADDDEAWAEECEREKAASLTDLW